ERPTQRQRDHASSRGRSRRRTHQTGGDRRVDEDARPREGGRGVGGEALEDPAAALGAVPNPIEEAAAQVLPALDEPASRVAQPPVGAAHDAVAERLTGLLTGLAEGGLGAGGERLRFTAR